MHNWSPLSVTKINKYKKNVVLVDTTAKLVHMELTPSPYPNTKAVKVQTGASMESLLTFLETKGLGIYAAPAPGDITVGGVLAIGGHGSVVPALNETKKPGYSYGTLSNLIMSLTAVVWNPDQNAYVEKTFVRLDAETKAFLVHLGRAFITEVTLMVGPNYNLRCESHVDIPAKELFADPANVTSDTRTFSSFLEEAGRVEAIMFVFTDKPWLKIWSICPKKPFILTREVSHPYNYVFTNIIPKSVSTLIGEVTNGAWVETPTLGILQSTIVSAGLPATLSFDLWGLSKNLLLYVKPTTLRHTANGYVIITRRRDVQRVVSEIVKSYNKLLNDFANRLIYPLNGEIEIRATLLDQPGGVMSDVMDVPVFSAARPVPDHPEFDVAVWLSILSFPGAPHQNEAYAKFEECLNSKFDGKYAIVRPEWSKGWAYTEQSAWNNTAYFDHIPNLYSHTLSDDGWNFGVNTLDRYDPYRIFTNEFLDKFLRVKV